MSANATVIRVRGGGASDDADAVGGFESDGSLNADLGEEPEWPTEVTNERKCASTRLSPVLPCVVWGGRCRRARVLELPHCPVLVAA